MLDSGGAKASLGKPGLALSCGRAVSYFFQILAKLNIFNYKIEQQTAALGLFILFLLLAGRSGFRAGKLCKDKL